MIWLLKIVDWASGPRGTQFENSQSWRYVRLAGWLVLLVVGLGVVIHFAPDLWKVSDHDLLVLILISLWLRR